MATAFTVVPSITPSLPLQATIPAYLYQEYSDDDDVQALVDAYNTITQEYVDFFNTINLPVYTGVNIAGPLLDWVAQGIYGIPRPTLTSGRVTVYGPFDTAVFNSVPFAGTVMSGNETFTMVNDDIYKRIITWAFYKGDGKTFSIKWLKRRIMRFLRGTNGIAPNIDDTSQVSVQFGSGNIVDVVISTGVYDITAKPLLIAAINAGVCELPFQYTFNVT